MRRKSSIDSKFQIPDSPRTPRTSRRGQVMLLTILALGSTLLGATTIAGLLMLYQIRQATDLGNSAKAIFAADAGIEQAYYNLSCAEDPSKDPCPAETPVFTNGASLVVTCFNAIIESACSGDEVTRIRSVGHGGSSFRAFEANF